MQCLCTGKGLNEPAGEGGGRGARPRGGGAPGGSDLRLVLIPAGVCNWAQTAVNLNAPGPCRTAPNINSRPCWVKSLLRLFPLVHSRVDDSEVEEFPGPHSSDSFFCKEISVPCFLPHGDSIFIEGTLGFWLLFNTFSWWEKSATWKVSFTLSRGTYISESRGPFPGDLLAPVPSKPSPK